MKRLCPLTVKLCPRSTATIAASGVGATTRFFPTWVSRRPSGKVGHEMGYKIEDNDNFELKGQFPKELRTNTFSAIQAQLNNLGREIKKVNAKVYAAQVGCEQCKGPYYTKYFPLKEEGKTLEEAYYTQFGAPFQGRGYKATALGFYQRNNANPSHEENSSLIKEIRALMDVAIRNQGASIKTLEIQIRQMSKVLQERGFGSLPSSTETNPRDHVKSISTIVEADTSSLRRIGSHQYVDHMNHNFQKLTHMELHILINPHPKRRKTQGVSLYLAILIIFCFDNALADLGAIVSVMPLSTYLNLGLGKLDHTKLTVKLVDRTVKYPKGIAKNVLVGIGKFVFPVDFIILDMPKDIKVPWILGRPFLSTAHAKIDVFKRKITLRVGEEKMELDLEARLMGETLRDQVDDLMPTIKEGEVVKEFKARNDARMDKLEYKGNIVVGALMNIPIFVGTFSILTDFVVLEDMDGYRDEGMGDVIFGKPFLREVGINARQFEGMITIYNGNEEVTYQMVRSHPRFKRHTNEQCNKVLSLLKVSKEDKMNGISHPYQKLKSFYKRVLNLGPEYVRDAKMEERLTHGDISVHEMV
nr:hypothetical protein [Tanacetum cinerariifolium]